MFIPIWTILRLISLALWLTEILLVVRVIISWVPQWNRSAWGRLVVLLTEPILMPLRRVTRIPGPGIGLDFSPMLALFIIHLIRLVFRF